MYMYGFHVHWGVFTCVCGFHVHQGCVHMCVWFPCSSGVYSHVCVVRVDASCHPQLLLPCLFIKQVSVNLIVSFLVYQC